MMITTVAVDEIRVKNVQLLLCVHGVEDFEDVDAQELIVAIYQCHYIIGIAEFSGCPINVRKRRHALAVFDYVYRLWDWVFLDKSLSELECIVVRGIVYHHHFEIGVILVVDRLDIVLVAEVLTVVASWYHQAKGQLRQAKIVLF